MMFQEAKITGSKYCGPVALSAVTGIDTKRICKAIRRMTGRPLVKGLHIQELLNFLRLVNVKAKRVPIGYGRQIFRVWHDEHSSRKKVHLVNVTGHFLVVRGREIICTQFGGRIGSVEESKYLRTRIKSVWEIEGEPDMAKLKEYIRPEPEIGTVSAKTKLTRLANKYGLKVERDGGDYSVWVWWPEDRIQSMFGGDDPFDGDHCFCNCQDAIDAIEEVIRNSSVEKVS